MKSGTYRFLNIILFLVFFLAIGKVGFDLFWFDEKIARELDIVEVSQKQKISENANWLGIFIVVMVLSAISLIVLQNVFLRQPIISGNIQKNTKKGNQNADRQDQTGQESFEDLVDNIRHLPSKQMYEKVISSVCKYLKASQGAFYVIKQKEAYRSAEFVAGYAYYIPETEILEYELGEGLVGQVAKDGKSVLIKNVPEGYIKVISGLGSAKPSSMIICPVKNKDQEVIAILEVASFEVLGESHRVYIERTAHYLSPFIEEKSISENELQSS